MKEARIERDRAFANLEARDKALYHAVYQCISDEMERNAGLTYEEWRVQAVRRSRRLDKLRVALRGRTYSSVVAIHNLQRARTRARA